MSQKPSGDFDINRPSTWKAEYRDEFFARVQLLVDRLNMDRGEALLTTHRLLKPIVERNTGWIYLDCTEQKQCTTLTNQEIREEMTPKANKISIERPTLEDLRLGYYDSGYVARAFPTALEQSNGNMDIALLACELAWISSEKTRIEYD